MKRHFYPAVVILFGVISAQILFSVFVYLSDISLYQSLVAFHHSGYLIVPNERVMPSLKHIRPAVCGGLFFSLTTGAGLSIVTFLMVCTWRSRFNEYRVPAVLLAAAAVFLTIKLRYNILLIIPCLLTVAATIYATLKFYPESNTVSFSLFRMLAGHLVVILLIVLVWAPVFSKDMFISIRDNLLLSNPVGQSINDFYYRYTLYPAESFKSLDQKLLKSCHINVDDPRLYPQLRHRLLLSDYLPVAAKFEADISVIRKKDRLLFIRNAKPIYECAIKNFLVAPAKILEQISAKTDSAKFLRKITFLSLIFASPLICYLFLHTIFMLFMPFIKSDKKRFVSASCACLVVFSLFSLPFYLQPLNEFRPADLAKYFKSDRWQDRVAALKYISDKNLPVGHYIDPEKPVGSPVVAERYWLAKALGNSQSPGAYALILQMLNDPQPNVVCMALYSLGKTHNRSVTDAIISRIRSSSQWYVQWYAYKALKRLGWTQKK